MESFAPGRNVALAVHGAPNHAELHRLGLRPESLLDFSSNINAYGPSPAVCEAIARTPLDRYPDGAARALRAALAEHLGVSPPCILAANGSSELIWLASLAFLRPRDRVLVLGPTYAEYERMAALMGARLKNLLAQEDNCFALSPLEITDALDTWRPRLVFLANPNNPTGTVLKAQTIIHWSQVYPDTLFIVDESYGTFVLNLGSVMDTKRDNVLVFRSMTKDFALAGLRLGYAVGAETLLSALSCVQPPWSVNALAQTAGVAALQDREHLARSLALLRTAKSELMAALATIGLLVVPSAAPFFLVRAGDASTVRRALLHRSILVRDCTSFGLPTYIRICSRRPEENVRLVAALQEVIHAG